MGIVIKSQRGERLWESTISSLGMTVWTSIEQALQVSRNEISEPVLYVCLSDWESP